jgi:hypothetical protein
MAQFDTEKAQSRAVSATATNPLLELPRLLQAEADTLLRCLEVKSCLNCGNSALLWSVESNLFNNNRVLNCNLF